MNNLIVVGRHFRDASTNARWPYVGMTASALFRRWLQRDGPLALVAPNLAQWRQMAMEGGYDGDITLRTFRGAAPPNAFALDPASYQERDVAEFTDFCNARNFRIDWTLGDAQLLFGDNWSRRQQSTNEFCRALVGCKTNFVQGLNEPFKNGGLEGFSLPRWGTYLRDSGMYYFGPWDQNTVLDFVSFHTPRDIDGGVPKWLSELYTSALYLDAKVSVPAVQNEPMGFAEVASGSRSTDPWCAERVGLALAFSGVGFHSTAGHSCDAFGPVTRRCAVAYFRGAAAAAKLIASE